MRLALLSDVHSNLQALEAVTEALRPLVPDALLCLGDVVGYGADPSACLAWARAECELVLMGNHDRQVAYPDEGERFNTSAFQALRWTAGVLSDQERAWLGGLPYTAARGELFLSHGSPVDPENFPYIFYRSEADRALEAIELPYLAVGHSHVQGCYVQGRKLEAPQAGVAVPLGPGPALMNPGSIGQPRDGDPRAAFGILDLEARTFTPQRVAYDIEGARRAILAAGLPQELGDRLRVGR
jgi:diadenosine tetraphosphatase ApaH/serine/threonine PP2A family protein phosphatase